MNKRLLAALCIMLALPLCAARCEQAAPGIITVAQGELGYTELANNYSKYGEWAGAAYREWCAEFACWCAWQADERYGTSTLETVYPKRSTATACETWFIKRGRYVSSKGVLTGYGDQWYWESGASVKDTPYVPQPGDFIFFDWQKGGGAEHTGLVEYAQTDASGAVRVHTIEGNNSVLGPTPTVVARYEYALDDKSIRGYGITADEAIGSDFKVYSTGEAVKALQNRLRALGYLKTYATGEYSGDTVRAVYAFQRAQGLPVHRVADAVTQRCLKDAYTQSLQTAP